MINPENNVSRHVSELTVKGFAFIIVLNYRSGKLLMGCLKIFRVINTEIFQVHKMWIFIYIVIQLHEQETIFLSFRARAALDTIAGRQKFQIGRPRT